MIPKNMQNMFVMSFVSLSDIGVCMFFWQFTIRKKELKIPIINIPNSFYKVV